MEREKVIKELYEKDPQFRELKDKHEELDKKIRKLEKHHPMTHDLEMEIERLKKEKLRYKDMMEMKIQEYMKAVK
ncbi:YdcH family protein [Aquifex sp.]